MGRECVRGRWEEGDGERVCEREMGGGRWRESVGGRWGIVRRVRERWENKMREEMREEEGERREMKKEGTEVNVMCNSQQDFMLTNRG